jgi:two-component system phosphate regulon response regulator PhoB
MSQILVVEDDEDIAILEAYNLKKEGFRVSLAKSAEEGLKLIQKEKPALIVLDLMLPGMDGFTFCKTVRANPDLAKIPIIIVSAKGEERDVVKGLEMGADDYVSKPFSPKVLVARAKTVLRRSPASSTDMVSTGALEIDPTRRQARVDGKEVKLTAMEFDVLHHFMRHVGWVFTRYQIIDSIHGEDYPVTDRSVDVCIVGLRKKLGEFGEMIETVRGVGYRFKEA